MGKEGEGDAVYVWGREEKEKNMSIFFFKQKTAYEIYQCDWSSDVCSSDLGIIRRMILRKV